MSEDENIQVEIFASIAMVINASC